ncbi:MAG: zinc-ribbon domain-containing protein [Anaerolineae bacterium]
MSAGSVLVGLALLLVTVAYLARPFRRTTAVDIEQMIDTWVELVRAEQVDESARFCRQCGRRVGADDRFCAACGAPLSGGVA